MAIIVFIAVLVTLLVAAFRFANSIAVIWIALGALVAFPFYNTMAANSCEGGCDIRVDLLLVFPVVLVLVVLALRKAWALWRAKQ